MNIIKFNAYITKFEEKDCHKKNFLKVQHGLQMAFLEKQGRRLNILKSKVLFVLRWKVHVLLLFVNIEI